MTGLQPVLPLLMLPLSPEPQLLSLLMLVRMPLMPKPQL